MTGIGFAASATVADLRDAARFLAAAPVAGMPIALLADEAKALQELVEYAQSRQLSIVGEMHAVGASDILVQLPTASWIRDALRLSQNAASRTVKLAMALRSSLPLVADGFAAGSITLQQAQVAAMALRDVPSERHAEADRTMASLAMQFGVADFAILARRLSIVAATDGGERSFERQHQGRRFSMAQTLDAEAGATVMAALDPLCRPLGPDDSRTGAQRSADALTEIAKHALDMGQLPQRGGVRPHLQVTIDLGTLIDREVPEGNISLSAAGLLGAGQAQIHGSGPIPRSVWERISCDAAVRRIVLDPDGCPLDVGRMARTATGAQRAALLARDGGCAYPACHRPVGWVDIHHIVHWRNGGKTNLRNLIMLCRHHHSALHRDRYRIELRGDDAEFVDRTGRSLGRRRLRTRGRTR